MNRLLAIENLRIKFHDGSSVVDAINGVSLDIFEDEVLGLVGESGSGKTITALSVVKILPDSAEIIEGKILFKGGNLLACSEEKLELIRGKEISYIFQEASASLNPVVTVGRQIKETIILHQERGKDKQNLALEELLDMVRLPNPQRIINSYPHQLSGGMNQRVMIALALASRPKLLIADEPTSSLDLTIEHEIIKMLLELKGELGFSILFISHNLSLVRKFADRIAIMFGGKIVEEGAVDSIFKSPSHRHTKELIEALI